MKTIAFFNGKTGVGTTTLVYHLAHMFPRLGYPTLAVDLDPQASLTSAFFDEAALTELWRESELLMAGEFSIEGTGALEGRAPREVAECLWVVTADLVPPRLEEKLSDSWSRALNSDQTALRKISMFHRIIKQAASAVDAGVALLDVGPTLGAITRSTLLAADFLVIPLAPDLLSLQGLRNLGPTVRGWQRQWRQIQNRAEANTDLPPGDMTPAGYIVLQPVVRLDRPPNAYGRWMKLIPTAYCQAVAHEDSSAGKGISHDEHCLGCLPNFRSLAPMAQEARKPMFDLSPADGAIGSHSQLVQTCEIEFRRLAERIAERCGLEKR